MKKLIASLLLLGLSTSSFGFCPDSATNPYESAYCKIAAEHANIPLPSERDFQANNPKVQYLLIKRHAKKAGIALSKPQSLNKAKPKPRSRVVKTNPPPSPSQSKSQPVINTTITSSAVAIPFETISPRCQRHNTRITCNDLRYQLQRGRSIAQITDTALASNNQLLFPTYQGQSKSSYLKQTYALYLEKMRSIGLDSKTMTFSKFASAFENYDALQGQFSERFSTMFDYLKRDRRNAPGHPGGSAPQNIAKAQCYQVQQSMVVCDEKGSNYLFVAEG